MEQLNLFEMHSKPYKITKPVRLIELFAGIGAQAKALERLGVQFERYRVIEVDKYAIASYNAIHKTQFNTSDITKITAKDLGIEDSDSYEYIMTYSFPCQDLSKSGKGKGMKKGSGTRSGLLWEVERLLNECEELPQILLMENVPDVIQKNNIKDFQEWHRSLEELGYQNYIECLNAKDYGIPQTRNRAYMISIHGEGYYHFPNKKKLDRCLKDLLEKEVDSSYYLSQERLVKVLKNKRRQGRHLNDIDRICVTVTTKVPMIIGTTFNQEEVKGHTVDIKGLAIRENTRKGFAIAEDGDGIYIDRTAQKRGVVQKGMIQTLKTSCSDVAVVLSADKKPLYYVRKLTALECWRLMGFSDEDYKKAAEIVCKTQLYKQAGNSIVVDVLVAIFRKLF